MTRTAGEVLEAITARLAPDPSANPLLPLIDSGAAEVGTLAVLGLEQRLVIAADLRSFRHLAERSAVGEPDVVPFFEMLAEGEAMAAGWDTGRISEKTGAHLRSFSAELPNTGPGLHPSGWRRRASWAERPGDTVKVALSDNVVGGPTAGLAGRQACGDLVRPPSGGRGR
ncbi:hypothetical protein ACF090_12165 [Streptomyces sp. NPDC014892]|uniref:hypothetical protein n=1 Tax=Streptomyces sp. NPDC014892 TaxID=3364930 RepID=UPI0036FEDDAB